MVIVISNPYGFFSLERLPSMPWTHEPPRPGCTRCFGAGQRRKNYVACLGVPSDGVDRVVWVWGLGTHLPVALNTKTLGVWNLILSTKWGEIVTLGGGLTHFLLLPLPGEMIQFDEHIFQMGWNHHLANLIHTIHGMVRNLHSQALGMVLKPI